MPPLDRAQLEEVVTGPAHALDVEFEDDRTVDRITAAAAAKPGALPLLSYLMTDMWEDMSKGSEAKLRLPAQAIDIGGVLAARADRFLEENPGKEPILRRLLTLRLCTVQPEGEPVRRQTRREDCPPPEWELACRLADYPWRLVATSERVDGVIVAEVAHEAMLREWPLLEEWLRERREFLVFKADAERAEKRWREADKSDAALLNGLDLTRAERWMHDQSDDLPPAVKDYVSKSIETDGLRKQRQLRFQKRVSAGAIAAVVVLTVAFAIAAWEAVIASRQMSRADDALAKAQETQSLFLADLAREEMGRSDFVSAMLLSLAGLPDGSGPAADGGARPYVAEVEGSLYEGYARHWEKFLLADHHYGRDPKHDGDRDKFINSVSASLKGNRIVTGAADGTARVWDAAGGREIAMFGDPGGAIHYAAVSPDGTSVVTGSDDMTAQVWEAATGLPQHELLVQGVPIRGIAYTSDGKRIITAHGDNTIHLWDAATGSPGTVIAGPGGPVTGVAVSSDGTRVASLYEDGAVKVWDAATGNVIAAIPPYDWPVSSVAISPDGTRIVTGSYDKKAVVWDAATGAKVHELEGHQNVVRSVAISPDGKRIATGSEDRTARLWDTTSGTQLEVLAGDIGAVLSVAFTSDGASIVTGSDDRSARLWVQEAGGLAIVLAGHGGAVSSVAFSTKSNLLATGSADKTVRLWDAVSGKPIKVLNQTDRVSSVAVDAAGMRVVSGLSDGTAILWDVTGGQPIRTFSGHVGQVSVAISADGSRIVTGGDDDKTVRVWDPAIDQPLTVISGLAGRVTSVLITPDRDRIVTAAGTVARVWDAGTGRQIIPQGLMHVGSVLCLALSADGARIVTGARDGFAKIWDATNGKLIANLAVRDGAVTGVAISPDGTRIVTGSSDDKVRLWHAGTGNEIATIEIDATPVAGLAISADGTHIATGSSETNARLSRLFVKYPLLVNEAKHNAPRCLLRSQLIQFHLPAEPPRWCITGADHESETDSARWEPKWPYQSDEWRQWQVARDKGQTIAMPLQ